MSGVSLQGQWWPGLVLYLYGIGTERVNTSPPGQNSRYFPEDIFKYILMNEKFCILIRISLKFVPKGPINNIPTLVPIMACCLIGDKPLSEPMLTQSTDSYVALGGDELIC